MCIYKMLVTGTVVCMVICASTDCGGVQVVNSHSPMITLRAVVPERIEIGWWDGTPRMIDLLGDDGELAGLDSREVKFKVSKEIKAKLVVHGDFSAVDPRTNRRVNFYGFFFHKGDNKVEFNSNVSTSDTTVIKPTENVSVLFAMAHTSSAMPGTYVTSVTLEFIAVDEEEAPQPPPPPQDDSSVMSNAHTEQPSGSSEPPSEPSE